MLRVATAKPLEGRAGANLQFAKATALAVAFFVVGAGVSDARYGGFEPILEDARIEQTQGIIGY